MNRETGACSLLDMPGGLRESSQSLPSEPEAEVQQEGNRKCGSDEGNGDVLGSNPPFLLPAGQPQGTKLLSGCISVTMLVTGATILLDQGCHSDSVLQQISGTQQRDKMR